MMTGQGVKMVAYETVNTITNQGPPMSKEKGLVSIWILSMLNAGPKTVIIVPYRSRGRRAAWPGGPFRLLRPYSAGAAEDHARGDPDDAPTRNWRSKIGVSPERALKHRAGRDRLPGRRAHAGELHHARGPAPRLDYLNNLWGPGNTDPLRGRRGQLLQRRSAGAGQEGPGPVLTRWSRFPRRRCSRPASRCPTAIARSTSWPAKRSWRNWPARSSA